MKKNELTKDEMNYLVGGSTSNLDVFSTEIKNINQTDGCVCTYNNFGAISNDNQVSGCRCKCVVN